MLLAALGDAIMGELVARGLAVILVSSELEEVLGMSDEIVVMHRGRGALRWPRATRRAAGAASRAAWAPSRSCRRGAGRGREAPLGLLLLALQGLIGLRAPEYLSPGNLNNVL